MPTLVAAADAIETGLRPSRAEACPRYAGTFLTALEERHGAIRAIRATASDHCDAKFRLFYLHSAPN